MGLMNIFGTSYEPTAAFSFEFKDRKTGGIIGKEIFFLLPPEEYSMQEGYRVNLTKTAAGGWIDDFGNDFKKIRLTGSLYSYYTGFPATFSQKATQDTKFFKKVGTQILRAGQKALNESVQLVKGLTSSVLNETGIDIPGLKGLSGLEEFFRLRYYVSRFRDRYTDPNTKSEYQYIIGKKYPDIEQLRQIAKTGNQFYDKIMIFFHDYDDDNHYEVVFDNFQMSRNKSDPFTINYSIEMTAIRLARTWGYNAVDKIVKKENPFQVLAQFKDAYSQLLVNFQTIIAVPGNIGKTIVGLYASCVDMFNYFIDFTNSVTADWKQFVSYLDAISKKNADFINLTITYAFGQSYENFLNESLNIQDLSSPYNLSNDTLDAVAVCEDNAQQTSEMKGTEKYFSNEEKTRIYKSDQQVINDTDFNADAQSSDDNVYITRDKTYYQVQQGDTLQTIAIKFYNDYEKASIIAQSNDLTNINFENGGMIGKSIIVPMESKSSVPLMTNNLVYFKRLSIATPDERQLQILGGDIQLDKDRQIHADGTGDLPMVFGQDCYLANITDRLQFETGTLAPIHPEWGVVVSYGEVPASILLDRVYSNIEDQIDQDPRTEIGFIDRDNIDLEADVLKLPILLKPYSGSETQINVGSILPMGLV